MKKLLLLLLLIPNLVMGESFYLICDGLEETQYLGDNTKLNKSFGVEVSDEYLTFNGTKYFNKEKIANPTVKYTKTQNSINFAFAGDSSISQGSIDRISGQISYEVFHTQINSTVFFAGICKIGDKAF